MKMTNMNAFLYFQRVLLLDNSQDKITNGPHRKLRPQGADPIKMLYLTDGSHLMNKSDPAD